MLAKNRTLPKPCKLLALVSALWIPSPFFLWTEPALEVHRDLKPLNFFLFPDGGVKIGDLGVSRQMSEQTLVLNSFYGSPLYLSPEIVQGQPYGMATDIWSLGVVLYELLALQPPFNGRSLNAVTQAVVSGEYSQPLQSSSFLTYSRYLKAGEQSTVYEIRVSESYTSKTLARYHFGCPKKCLETRAAPPSMK